MQLSKINAANYGGCYCYKCGLKKIFNIVMSTAKEAVEARHCKEHNSSEQTNECGIECTEGQHVLRPKQQTKATVKPL